jgi:hypothetical protein
MWNYASAFLTWINPLKSELFLLTQRLQIYIQAREIAKATITTAIAPVAPEIIPGRLQNRGN